jgi:hypothetical protein
VAAFWTLSDVGRGQSGKGGAVRTVSPGADAREIKTISKLSSKKFNKLLFFLQV